MLSNKKCRSYIHLKASNEELNFLYFSSHEVIKVPDINHLKLIMFSEMVSLLIKRVKIEVLQKSEFFSLRRIFVQNGRKILTRVGNTVQYSSISAIIDMPTAGWFEKNVRS
jgi:hypothetical protein